MNKKEELFATASDTVIRGVLGKERVIQMVQVGNRVFFLRRTNKTLCTWSRRIAVIPAATGRGTYLTRDISIAPQPATVDGDT